MLDREGLILACKTGMPVLYEDKVRSLVILGQVTGIITRFERGVSVISAEVRDMRTPCIYRCRPEDLSLWKGQVLNENNGESRYD